jgi:hypothetical protein
MGLRFPDFLGQVSRVAARPLADGRPAGEPEKGFRGTRPLLEPPHERDRIPDELPELMDNPMTVPLAAHLINLLPVNLWLTIAAALPG